MTRFPESCPMVPETCGILHTYPTHDRNRLGESGDNRFPSFWPIPESLISRKKSNIFTQILDFFWYRCCGPYGSIRGSPQSPELIPGCFRSFWRNFRSILVGRFLSVRYHSYDHETTKFQIVDIDTEFKYWKKVLQAARSLRGLKYPPHGFTHCLIKP